MKASPLNTLWRGVSVTMWAAVYRDGKCGFIDLTGAALIPFIFDECRGMKDGTGAVRLDKKWGFINKTGDLFIEPRFEDAELFFDGLAAVAQKGTWGFIDRTGRFVIPPQFEYSRVEPTITEFSEGLAGAMKDGRFGYIDRSGTFIIAPAYKKGLHFQNGVAEVCDASACGYVDKPARFGRRTTESTKSDVRRVSQPIGKTQTSVVAFLRTALRHQCAVNRGPNSGFFAGWHPTRSPPPKIAFFRSTETT